MLIWLLFVVVDVVVVVVVVRLRWAQGQPAGIIAWPNVGNAEASARSSGHP